MITSINYLYINKVCDVCDSHQSKIYKGGYPHGSSISLVRKVCARVKLVGSLQGVQRLMFSSFPLRGLLQCKYMSNISHATPIL